MSEEVIMKKSIFTKGIKKYYPIFCIRESYSMIGNVKQYYEDFPQSVYDPLVNHEIIKEIDIPMPLLNKGDEFYFEDTKQSVSIKQVMRTSEGNVIYMIETEIVEDVEAKKQYDIDRNKFYEMNKQRTNEKIKKLESRGLLERIINKRID